jgi:hypothetical protein
MPPNVATGKPQKLLPIADFRLPICDCDCQLPLADCYSGELRAETIGNWQSAIFVGVLPLSFQLIMMLGAPATFTVPL